MHLLSGLYQHHHLGLLLLRIGIGIMFIFHGLPKLIGGPDYWEQVGNAMANLGINFAPAFWGLLAGLTEFGGGILLLTGLFFRPACVLLFLTMVVATISHLGRGDSFSTYSHAAEMAILFLGFLFIGPGLYSLDARLKQKPAG